MMQVPDSILRYITAYPGVACSTAEPQRHLGVHPVLCRTQPSKLLAQGKKRLQSLKASQTPAQTACRPQGKIAKLEPPIARAAGEGPRILGDD